MPRSAPGCRWIITIVIIIIIMIIIVLMQVEDEVECGCGCPAHLQADCSGPGHAFNKEACQCECRDQAARRRSEYYHNVT